MPPTRVTAKIELAVRYGKAFASMTAAIMRLKDEGDNLLATLDSGDVDPASVDGQRLHCVVESGLFLRPKQSCRFSPVGPKSNIEGFNPLLQER